MLAEHLQGLTVNQEAPRNHPRDFSRGRGGGRTGQRSGNERVFLNAHGRNETRAPHLQHNLTLS